MTQKPTEWPSVARAPLPLRFSDFHVFKDFVWNGYEPLPEELPGEHENGFLPGMNWGRRHSPRFYRALRAIHSFTRPGARLLDIGTYPGTFPRLARAAFGEELEIETCGMPVTQRFAESLANEGIAFRACNLDPDIICADASIPVGLPYESESIDIITCTEVIEHLYSLKTLFQEVRRVLSPGGILYATTNNVMDRRGLIRIFHNHDTNLDDDIDQTTIWSDHTDLWRRHVRFYSIPLLGRTARRAGLELFSSTGFTAYEDPGVYQFPDRGLIGKFRKWSRGRGDAPPRRWKTNALAIWHLGFRSLSHAYDTQIQVMFRKPYQ